MVSERVSNAANFAVGASMAGAAFYGALTNAMAQTAANTVLVGGSGDVGAATTAALFVLDCFVMGYSVVGE